MLRFPKRKEAPCHRGDPSTSSNSPHKCFGAVAQTQGTQFPPTPRWPRPRGAAGMVPTEARVAPQGQGPLSRLQAWPLCTDLETEAQRHKVA